MSIELQDTTKKQFHESLEKRAGGISGIHEALKQNPMPDQLLSDIQQGKLAAQERGIG